MDEGEFFSMLLSSVGFADDMKFIATSNSDLQTMVLIFHRFCGIFGFKFNIPKCVCMVTQRVFASQTELRQERLDDLVIMVEGKQIKVVTETPYLGTVECDTNDLSVEMATRCARLTGAFHSWGRVTLNPHVSLLARLRILDSTVVQIALFNCQS